MSHVTYSYVNESWHIWSSHATYEWVTSDMNESYYILAIQISRVTYGRVMPHELRHTWIMPHMNESCHTLIYEWVMSHSRDMSCILASCHRQSAGSLWYTLAAANRSACVAVRACCSACVLQCVRVAVRACCSACVLQCVRVAVYWSVL